MTVMRIQTFGFYDVRVARVGQFERRRGEEGWWSYENTLSSGVFASKADSVEI